jgi:hypothetical protein
MHMAKKLNLSMAEKGCGQNVIFRMPGKSWIGLISSNSETGRRRRRRRRSRRRRRFVVPRSGAILSHLVKINCNQFIFIESELCAKTTSLNS